MNTMGVGMAGNDRALANQSISRIEDLAELNASNVKTIYDRLRRKAKSDHFSEAEIFAFFRRSSFSLAK